jgi:hypothetical protein
MRHSSFPVVGCGFIVMLLSAGCGAPAGGGSSVCAEAVAHLSSCSGGGEASAPDSCDNAQAAAAEDVLASSCEQLNSGAGKSDGNDVVCTLLTVSTLGLAAPSNLPNESLCCYDWQCQNAKPCFLGSCSGPVACINHHCRPKLAAGGDCGLDNGACQRGLTCLPSKKCGAPLAAGAVCAERGDCAEPLTCNASKRCAEAAADGATCRNNDQCINTCIAGSCAPRPAESGACDDSGDCQAGLACVNRVCIKPAVGSACAKVNDCPLGMSCQFGACAPKSASGADCDPAATFPCEQFGDTCFRGTCEPRHATGGACDQIFDCQRDLCRNHVCGG